MGPIRADNRGKDQSSGVAMALAVWRYRVLAVVAGAIPALAFPAPSVALFGVVGLVPLMLLVFSAGSARDAIWRVWLGGVGYFIAVHHWLIPVTGPFVVPLASLLAALWIPWGWLGWRILGQRRSIPRLVAALVIVPSAWVAAEYVRAWGQLGGPWGLLGATQWANRPLLGVVSIGGVWLLSYVLVAVNVAITSLLAPAASPRERVVAASVGAGLLLAAVAVPSMLPFSESGVFRVAGVQPGIVHGGAERIAAHMELTRSLIGEDLDLIAVSYTHLRAHET